MEDEIFEVADVITDVADDADSVPGLGTALAVVAAGSLIATGIATGGKWVFNKAKDAWAARKAKKDVDTKADEINKSESEVVETTEA